MTKSSTDIDELVDKAVRELRVEYEDGEHHGVTVKAHKLGISKDRLHCQLKGIGPHTT
jgi:hypothetical protein